MDRNGNVILGGVRAGRDPDRHPAAAPTAAPTRPSAPAARSTARRSGSPAASPGCWCAPEGTLTFTVGGGPGAYPATFTVVRVGPTGAPDPTFGGTGDRLARARPGQAPRHRRRGDPPGPVRHDARRRHRPDRRRHAARRGHPAQARRRAGHALRQPRRGAASPARAARSGSSRWPATAPGRILLAGSGQPPEALVMRLRASGAPRLDLRQRRRDLPAARPPARRRPDLHHASTRSTPSARAR